MAHLRALTYKLYLWMALWRACLCMEVYVREVKLAIKGVGVDVVRQTGFVTFVEWYTVHWPQLSIDTFSLLCTPVALALRSTRVMHCYHFITKQYKLRMVAMNNDHAISVCGNVWINYLCDLHICMRPYKNNFHRAPVTTSSYNVDKRNVS